MPYKPPLIPRFLFGVIEPLMMAGGISIFLNPQAFVDAQVPLSPSVPLTPANKLVALQLGNVGLLIGGIGSMILFRSTAPTVRAYLTLQSIADVSHVLIMYSIMGRKTFFTIGEWNFMTWANLVASSTLCMLRLATLAGCFGRIEQRAKSE